MRSMLFRTPMRSVLTLNLFSHSRLSELLSLPLPTLPSLQSSLTASFVTSGSSAANASSEEMGPQSLWADEEEKRFYEDLRELRGEVPASVLGVKEEQVQPAPPNADALTEEVPMPEDNEETSVADAKKGPEPADTECVTPMIHTRASTDGASVYRDPVAKLEAAEPDASLPSGPAAQLTAIFARLPEASSKKAIDDIALEFALLNSKAARKRLVKVSRHWKHPHTRSSAGADVNAWYFVRPSGPSAGIGKISCHTMAVLSERSTRTCRTLEKTLWRW